MQLEALQVGGWVWVAAGYTPWPLAVWAIGGVHAFLGASCAHGGVHLQQRLLSRPLAPLPTAQANDRPWPNHGVQTAYEFAHDVGGLDPSLYFGFRKE